MKLTYEEVTVETGSDDEDGRLVFADERLVAVLVRLAESHGPEAGFWFLEHGFNRLDNENHPKFRDLDEAEEWISRHLRKESR